MPHSFAILFLRVSVGVLMLAGHGWDKLAHFTERQATFPDPLNIGAGFSLSLAILAEVGCSIALILGLATRFAAVPLLATMLVAIFVVHAGDPWRERELAVLYAVPFLFLILSGGGDYSVDAWRRPRRRPRL